MSLSPNNYLGLLQTESIFIDEYGLLSPSAVFGDHMSIFMPCHTQSDATNRRLVDGQFFIGSMRTVKRRMSETGLVICRSL